MKLVVFGSTRGIGRKVVELALEAGHEVTAVARDPGSLDLPAHPRLRVLRGDALDSASVRASLEGQEGVISALGTTDRKSKVRSEGVRTILAAMKELGIERLVVVSAIGVADSREQAIRSSFVFGRIIMPLLLKHTFADIAEMETMIRASGLKWTIVRPTGLADRPRAGRVRTVTDGSKVSASVSRADVAAFLIDELVSPQFAGQAVSVGE